MLTKKNLYMKITSLLTVLATAWLLQACTQGEGKTKPIKVSNDQIPVKVMTLKKQDVHATIQTSGLFTTDDETQLAFKTTGVIEKVFVKEGDVIRKGQLLATLNLTEINTQVAQAELALEKAKRDHERISRLYTDSVATLEQLQNVKTNLDVTGKQLEAARFNRSFSEIRAMNNGFVLRKLANEGQVISSGTPVLQTNGAKEGKWILKAGVSDREWSMLSVGDRATITTDAMPGKSMEAKVIRKSKSTDATTGSFTIELSVTKNHEPLASGLFGKATLYTSSLQQSWKIPYDALLDGDALHGFVFVTSDNRTAHKISVTIGALENDYISITDGLEQATALIVSGSAYLRDGSLIKVIPD